MLIKLIGGIMKNLFIWGWIAVALWIIIIGSTFLVVISGCHAWQGLRQDFGIHKPESKSEVAPSPTVQLWRAAKNSNWLVTASILGMAAGVFALTNGATKLGMASIASASVSLFMSLAVARFALWMAVFGLIGSIAAALFSILARRKALMEIIKGTQELKSLTPDKEKANEILANNQTSITKQIVQVVKNGLKLNGQIK